MSCRRGSTRNAWSRPGSCSCGRQRRRKARGLEKVSGSSSGSSGGGGGVGDGGGGGGGAPVACSRARDNQRYIRNQVGGARDCWAGRASSACAQPWRCCSSETGTQYNDGL
eukprot:g10494.t1